jgi:EmrB/QacA subfamily drug resistance transporter
VLIIDQYSKRGKNVKFLGDRLTKEQIHEKRWQIHAVMSIGLILIVMAVSSLNVALPTLVREIGATATDLQWIVDSYALVFAGLLLFAGAIGDRFSRRWAFVSGLAIVAVTSYMSSIAEDSQDLIIWRGLMGIGAALVMPATLSIINNVFSEPKERTKAVALWAGFAGAGASIGPVVSGVLLENYWWGSIFLINIPVALLGIIGAYLLVPDSKDPESERLDFGGALLSVVGLAALLFGIIEAPIKGWLSAETLISVIVGLVVLGLFVWYELRSDHPMLPMEFFKSRSFAIGALSITLVFFAMFGMFFTVVQFMQFVLGYSALTAAVRTLPFTVALIAVSGVVPRFVEKFGIRRIIMTGMFMAAVGLGIFATLNPSSSYWVIFAGFVLSGAGIALSMPPATDALIGSVPERKAGVGSAMNDATREVGGAMGIAVLGSLLASEYRNGVGELAETLPEEAGQIVNESIGGAQAVAAELGEAGVELSTVASSAFSDGVVLTMVVGAAFLIGSAVLATFLMPNKIIPIKQK